MAKYDSRELALALAALAHENRAREHNLRHKDEHGNPAPRDWRDGETYGPEAVGNAISNAVRASRRLARRK